MDREAVFVDTWGWMALGHHREPRHAEVKRIYQELRSNQIPIHTSDYVLDEVITLLFRREVFEEAMRFALVKKRLPVLDGESGALCGHKNAKSLLNKYFVEGILGAAVLGQLRLSG